MPNATEKWNSLWEESQESQQQCEGSRCSDTGSPWRRSKRQGILSGLSGSQSEDYSRVKLTRDGFHYNLSHLVWRKIDTAVAGLTAGCCRLKQQLRHVNVKARAGENEEITLRRPFPFSLPGASYLRSGTASVKNKDDAQFL